MRRSYVLTCIFILSLTPFAISQSGGEDTIRYRDRAKGTIEVRSGPFTESVAGVEVTVAGKKLLVSPTDIISMTYGKLAGVDDTVRFELNQSDNRPAEESYAKHVQVLKSASTSGADDRTKRHLEFRTAMAHARLADTKSGEEFKTQAAGAIDRLTTVARSYKTWEVWPSARTAARLQAELGKFSDAGATLATLAKLEGLPPELANEAKLEEAAVLFRGGIALSAEPVIDALGKAKGLTPAQQSRLAIYQAALKGAKEKTDAAKVQAAAAAVKALIDKMTDADEKAMAHNALGELFLMANLLQDAKWQFCWVNACYNQNREERMKALGRLVEIFEKQDDKEHAATFREALLKEKAG